MASRTIFQDSAAQHVYTIGVPYLKLYPNEALLQKSLLELYGSCCLGNNYHILSSQQFSII